MIVRQKPAPGMGSLIPDSFPPIDPATFKWVAIGLGALWFLSAFRRHR